jgi:hypothetical protein
MKRMVCVVWLAACGGAPKSEQTMATGNTAAPTAGPSCAKVADHVIDVFSKGAPDAPPNMIKSIHDTLQNHCDKDGWSASSRTCFVNMSSKEAGNDCEEGLTADQKKSLESEDPTAGKPDSAATPPGGMKDTGTRGTPHKGGDPCDGGE